MGCANMQNLEACEGGKKLQKCNIYVVRIIQDIC